MLIVNDIYLIRPKSISVVGHINNCQTLIFDQSFDWISIYPRDAENEREREQVTTIVVFIRSKKCESKLAKFGCLASSIFHIEMVSAVVHHPNALQPKLFIYEFNGVDRDNVRRVALSTKLS